MIIDDLFIFPIVMVDGEEEERKEKENDLLGTKKEEKDYDIVYGEAAYPYYDFRGFEDRWLPTQRSLERALRSKFDACVVRFDNVGQFLVPMSKEKFRDMFSSFVESREKPDTDKKNVTILNFTPEMLAQIIKKADEDSNTNTEGMEGHPDAG